MKNIKKKYIIVIVSITLFSIALQAQDLIVTSEGDSLNCRITKIKKEYIYFTFKYKNEIRSTLLPSDQVKYHRYKFFQTVEVPESKVIGLERYPHFRVAVNGGWSYRLAKISDDTPSGFEEYEKKLKSGYHYNSDLSFYFSEQLGIGLKYSCYKSKNDIDNVYVIFLDGSTQFGTLHENISIHFIGPFVSTRLMNIDKTSSFLINFSLGYMGYKNKVVLDNNYTVKGSTVGFCWDFGYEIGISEKFALEFQFSFLYGMLSKFKILDGVHSEIVKLDKGEHEGLARIDLSVGLRFNL